MERIAFEYRNDEPFRIIKDDCIGTIRTMEGGGVSKYIMEVKVIGQMDNTIDHTFESANRVYDVCGVSPTINTCGGGGLQPKILEDKTIVAMCGRNPDNPSDRTAGSPTEQRLEPNSQGICNTLTSVQKDNLVMETNKPQYRIRKLTPLECWRLMDFSDEDFEKAAKDNSNTQLYKQAGNSIIRNVLVAILGQMIPGKENVYRQ